MPGSIPVLILGAGGHALVIWDVLECGGYRVIGFTDPGIPAGTLKYMGTVSRPVLEDDSVSDKHILADPDLKLFAGVGPEPTRVRQAVITRVGSSGSERMLKAVHPRAVLAASAQIGLDTVVMAGAVINPGVVIGRHCVINTGATVDHECHVSDNVFVQPGAHLAGRVVVEEGAIVGMGANVREGVRIGRNAYVGGGAFVNRDVPEGAMVVGVPARFLRYRSLD